MRSNSVEVGRLAVQADAMPGASPGHRLFADDSWNRIALALRLSRRELEIAKLMFDDKKESTIAELLQISPHTVHTHVDRLFRKLVVTSRASLIVSVVAAHLASDDHWRSGQRTP